MKKLSKNDKMQMCFTRLILYFYSKRKVVKYFVNYIPMNILQMKKV